MGILTGYEPQRALDFFEQISQIPRGSGHCEAISQYFIDFAKKRNLEYYTDKVHNVIIKKPASPGYENGQTVILQAHMDMVCVTEHGCTKDMEKEGLDLYLDGDRIRAKGTTLGADNGAAVALILAALDDDSIEHPKIEALFTSDEETGMYGAIGIDARQLTGKLMVNIDTTDERYITVGSAGGTTGFETISINREEFQGDVYEIVVNRLTGGHSGLEIHKGLANSNKLMGRVLYEISSRMDIRLISIDGGVVDNAIPTETKAVIVCHEEDKLNKVLKDAEKSLKHEYLYTDTGINLGCKKVRAEMLPMDEHSTKTIIFCTNITPNGIIRMSAVVDGLVQTSLNLGVIKTYDKEVRFTQCVRSSIDSERRMVVSKLRNMASYLGGEVNFAGGYPGWEYARVSPFRDMVCEVYETIYKRKPELVAIHAGLECGFFVSKIPGLECVSLATDLVDEHSPNESISIGSIDRVWNFLLGILKRLK